MKTLLLILMLVAVSAQGEPRKELWAFGDSLTGVPDSWLEIAAEREGIFLHNMARGLMTMAELEVPGFISCWNNRKARSAALVYLGGNDAIFRSSYYLYALRLGDALNQLDNRGCPVLLVSPAQELEGTEPYRRITAAVAARYSNVTLVELPHPIAQTIDGVHQSPEMHEMQADHAREFLAEIL